MSLNGIYNGLSFGTGTGYHVAGLDGLYDLPEVRSNDLPKANGGGYFAGVDRRGGRRIVLSLILIAADPAGLASLRAALVTATDVQPTELPLQLMGNTVYVYARPRRRTIPIDAQTMPEPRTGTATIEFFCSDPTIHAGTP